MMPSLRRLAPVIRHLVVVILISVCLSSVLVFYLSHTKGDNINSCCACWYGLPALSSTLIARKA